jgi:hypothetical protein
MKTKIAILVGFVGEVGSLILFVQLGRINAPDIYKDLTVFLWFLTPLITFLFFAEFYSIKSLVIISLWLSVLFFCVIDFLGSTIYPGLGSTDAFLSFAHLFSFILGTLAVFVYHMLVSLTVWLIRRKISLPKSERV